MSENTDLLGEIAEEQFDVQRRGYSRRQVDEYAARFRRHAADLDGQLARVLGETEQLQLELAAVRLAAAGGKPAHQEISERIAQILKLASEEASAQQDRAAQDISALRSQAQQQADACRADAASGARQILAAAQEQAEHDLTSARAEADGISGAAHAQAAHAEAAASEQARTATGTAAAQAELMLAEATARAAAIHDGAATRTGQLEEGQAEATHGLAGIGSVITSLLAGEAGRGTLPEEVAATMKATLAASGPPDPA
jgi:hypothetical protein